VTATLSAGDSVSDSSSASQPIKSNPTPSESDRFPESDLGPASNPVDGTAVFLESGAPGRSADFELSGAVRGSNAPASSAAFDLTAKLEPKPKPSPSTASQSRIALPSLSLSGPFSASAEKKKPVDSEGSGIGGAAVGGIVGAIIAVLAVIAGFVAFFATAKVRESQSNELEAHETDPNCAVSAESWIETEDLGYEHVNPDIETFQGGEEFFSDAHIEEGVFT
jgi:hypothetical protein